MVVCCVERLCECGLCGSCPSCDFGLLKCCVLYLCGVLLGCRKLSALSVVVRVVLSIVFLPVCAHLLCS